MRAGQTVYVTRWAIGHGIVEKPIARVVSSRRGEICVLSDRRELLRMTIGVDAFLTREAAQVDMDERLVWELVRIEMNATRLRQQRAA